VDTLVRRGPCWRAGAPVWAARRLLARAHAAQRDGTEIAPVDRASRFRPSATKGISMSSSLSRRRLKNGKNPMAVFSPGLQAGNREVKA
jgi:hypothetical protein